MRTTRPSRKPPTFICELNGSPVAQAATLTHARSQCAAHGAELVILWVIEPASLVPPSVAGGGGPGTFGLIGVSAFVSDRLRSHAVDADLVIRIGERGRVLKDEATRLGAERVITAADVPPQRCAACGARYDARAVHFCPRAHLERHQTGRIEPAAA